MGSFDAAALQFGAALNDRRTQRNAAGGMDLVDITDLLSALSLSVGKLGQQRKC